MIHLFKNHILRQRIDDSKAIMSSIGGAKTVLAHYKSLQHNQLEQQAISQIDKMLNAYFDALNIIDPLIQQQKTAKQIDNIVRINDLPALESLKILETENNNQQLINRVINFL